jgi:hypothetical protein
MMTWTPLPLMRRGKKGLSHFFLCLDDLVLLSWKELGLRFVHPNPRKY